MQRYLIMYCDVHNVELFWRCEADNEDHALEQLLDHERTLSGKALVLAMLEIASHSGEVV